MKKFIIFWVPVILWAGIIFYLSSIPDLKTDLSQDFFLRKIAHIVEYLILTLLIIRGLKKEKLSVKKIAIYSLIFAIFYALIDEYHQTFVLGRHGSLKDVGIDSVGILTAVWYYIKR